MQSCIHKITGHWLQDHKTLVEMDVSMAKFANVNVDFVHYFQTTDFTHLHRMSNLIDYIRSVYRDLGKDTRLMMLPQDGTPLHISMIEYFTRFRDDILQHAKQTCFDELTVFHLLSYMGKKGYDNGIGMVSAEERMAVSEKGYDNGIGMMSAEERTAESEKGCDNGIGAMSAEERMAAWQGWWQEKRATKWAWRGRRNALSSNHMTGCRREEPRYIICKKISWAINLPV